MFFTIVVGIICLLVGILFGALIERHFAAQAAEEELPPNVQRLPGGKLFEPKP